MNFTQLDPINARYLQGQIASGNSTNAKRALQQLCQLHRKGHRLFNPKDISSLENCVVGALFTQGSDPKIRRWALNAIAQFGRENTCREAVITTLQQYGDDPETAASAVAALFHLSKDAAQIINSKNIINEDIVVLAALQQVNPKDIPLETPRINVEIASPEILKLALVIVGMNKAPDNLFHPKHSNSELVKILGGHDDIIVSQYSVWAITENTTLGLKDLGIKLEDIEGKPTNIRSWVYQLVAMDSDSAYDNFEYIRLAASDLQAEARRGLTVGLKETYFDGLDAFVTDWLLNEGDEEVRTGLIDHIVRQAGKSTGYERMAIELYKDESQGAKQIERMEVAASGTALFGRFKQIKAQGDPDLFSLIKGDTIVTNNTFNVSGNLSGNISLGGDAINHGSISSNLDQRSIEIARAELTKASEILQQLDLPAPLKDETLAQITDAKNDPSSEKIGVAMTAIGKAKSFMEGATGIAENAVKLGTIIGTIAKLFVAP